MRVNLLVDRVFPPSVQVNLWMDEALRRRHAQGQQLVQGGGHAAQAGDGGREPVPAAGDCVSLLAKGDEVKRDCVLVVDQLVAFCTIAILRDVHATCSSRTASGTTCSSACGTSPTSRSRSRARRSRPTAGGVQSGALRIHGRELGEHRRRHPGE